MARLLLTEIAAAVRGELLPGDGAGEPGGRAIEGYSIDTRTLRPGDLFIAIVGPRVDGHGFLAEAVRKGAAAVMVTRDVAGARQDSAGAPAILRVSDTTRALQDLASHLRRRQRLQVVGITGSAGKTTAKEMTAAVLSTRFRTHRSEGNLNNTYGMPLTLLRMADDCQAAVLEMGMSYHGEITRLAEIADPDVGVILNVLPVHLEHFGSLDDIARAKGELFTGMRADATAVFNADDPRVARMGRAFKGPRLAFGTKSKNCQVAAEDISTEGLDGTRFVLRIESKRTPVRLALAGKHHVHNALAAAAVGHACGLDGAGIAAGLATVAPAPMRGVVHLSPRGVSVLDDAYNSNPAAMERAIELLRDTKPRGRRILAAGDMLELGPTGPRSHARIGALAARAGIDLLVAVGPLSQRTAAAASGIQVRHFDDSESAGVWLAAEARAGDLVLVKGSRGIRMEHVVRALLAGGGGR